MTAITLTALPVADSWGMHSSGGWWMVPMMLVMVLFWGAVILGFVWLVRDGFDRRTTKAEETALTILDRRFAEGAVSFDDYQQRRKVLTGATASPPSGGGSSAE